MSLFHFHRWGKYVYSNQLDMYEDGYYTRTVEVWIKYCETCGLPKKKRVKS